MYIPPKKFKELYICINLGTNPIVTSANASEIFYIYNNKNLYSVLALFQLTG